MSAETTRAEMERLHALMAADLAAAEPYVMPVDVARDYLAWLGELVEEVGR